MTISEIFIPFFLWSLFCLWMVKGNGAARLQGSFIVGLFWRRAHELPAEFLRELVKIVWFVSAILFVLKLYYRSA